MATTLVFPSVKPAKIGFIWFIPIYFLALTGAFILASSAFPVTISKNKIFGFALSQEQTFNQPLFMHLTAGIIFIAVVHLLTRIMAVNISTGNTILAVLLSVNIICFAIGINIPLLHTTRLGLIRDQLSLTQVLLNLKEKGEMRLYYIMLIFTFVIPILKMLAMAFDIFISKSYRRKNLLLSLLSKWAMLDVLIIGIIVSTMKSSSGIVEMTTGYGLSFFIASVLLSMIITNLLPFTKNN